jgi:hypothetical protein
LKSLSEIVGSEIEIYDSRNLNSQFKTRFGIAISNRTQKIYQNTTVSFIHIKNGVHQISQYPAVASYSFKSYSLQCRWDCDVYFGENFHVVSGANSMFRFASISES